MRAIIKIDGDVVGEYNFNPTQTVSVEYTQSEGSVNRNYFEKEQIYFMAFMNEYPGIKRGTVTEFNQFRKHKDWREELSKLPAALQLEKEYRAKKEWSHEFVAPWKNLKFWLKDRCWEIEYETKKPTPIIDRTVQFKQV